MLLSLITFLPIFGALVLLFLLQGDNELKTVNARNVALFTTSITFLLSISLLFPGFFEETGEGFYFVEEKLWFGFLSYKMGVDKLSVVFVLLTTFIMPLAILASWNVKHLSKEYMIAFLTLETFIIGVFCSLDAVLFYVFFESVLIPMFFIIGIWGGEKRVFASLKFFLYTFLGSILMLVAVISMFIETGTTDIVLLLAYQFPTDSLSIAGITISGGMQTLLWLAMFASFAVKTPMWPFHTWLPAAHVEAPTAGSVILAAILLKMGGYGFLRFSLPMFPEASAMFSETVIILSVIAIIYGSLVALAQEDIKKLIAYSSIAHMGIVTIGIFSGSQIGIDGAIFQMVSHGLISAALFMLVGFLYERFKTRQISAYGGIAQVMPAASVCFLLFTFANIAVPGTSGFVGEFLVFSSIFGEYTGLTMVAVLGVILSAGYGLWLYQRVFLGEKKIPKIANAKIFDLSRIERLTLLPLLIGICILGIFPTILIEGYTGVSAYLENHQSNKKDHMGYSQTFLQKPNILYALSE